MVEFGKLSESRINNLNYELFGVFFVVPDKFQVRKFYKKFNSQKFYEKLRQVCNFETKPEFLKMVCKKLF